VNLGVGKVAGRGKVKKKKKGKKADDRRERGRKRDTKKNAIYDNRNAKKGGLECIKKFRGAG